jgi:hypothetical protein
MKYLTIAFRNTFVCALILFYTDCSSDLQINAIPFQAFPDIQLNLALPDNLVLQSTGGYKVIAGGVKGILLYRKSTTTILAFERNCSYQPNDACATVGVHSSGIYMTDTCCNSNFSFDAGLPIGGPANQPLRQYAASLSGNTLLITDEVIN